VLLTFASPDQQTYVVVRGTAVMDHDREMIATLWNPGMKAWFPAGPTDPDLTLIHVTSETAEYWDAPAAPVRWLEFAKAVVTRGRSISGKHAALKFGL
jgi:general stress protein 26